MDPTSGTTDKTRVREVFPTLTFAAHESHGTLRTSATYPPKERRL